MCGDGLGRRLQISPLGDLSVVPRLGATERCLIDAEGSVHRVRVRMVHTYPDIAGMMAQLGMMPSPSCLAASARLTCHGNLL